jgi:16S rRNA (guanine966-N2)-methyltransferase
MRVIAGKYRSRALRSLRGMALRPTADRLRETLFDVLCGGNPLALDGCVWVDLFAGTGAVGIEALSRGASTAYFVDSSKRAVELIRANLASLAIRDAGQVMHEHAAKGLRHLEGKGVRADFIFLDPPYDLHAVYAEMLEMLSESPMLKEMSVVIAEHEKKLELPERRKSLARYRKLVQGDAALSFYRLQTAG